MSSNNTRKAFVDVTKAIVEWKGTISYLNFLLKIMKGESNTDELRGKKN
jgi:hypothetical protein